MHWSVQDVFSRFYIVVICNGISQRWSKKNLTCVTMVGFGLAACLSSRLPFINPDHLQFYQTCINPNIPFDRKKVGEADLIFTVCVLLILVFHLLALLMTIILFAWLLNKECQLRYLRALVSVNPLEAL